jgi:hypothetical protein
MVDIIDFATWAAGAVIVVGVMQWAKNLLKKIPTWIWSVVLPIVSLGASAAAAYKESDYSSIFWNAAGIWAISQVGYELIVQSIKKKLGAKGQ